MSLLETVIALFVLVSAFTILMSLLFQSSKALVKIEERALAVAFAETVDNDIRVWAENPDNFKSGWSDWSAKTLPEYPGYVARVEAKTRTLFTPCEPLEASKPVAEQRIMRESFRELAISIEKDGGQLFEMSTLVAEPDRGTPTVEVRIVSGSASLAADGALTLEAVLKDPSDNVIEDVSFHWNVEPSPEGNATISALATSFSQAELRNHYRHEDGVLRQVAGQCRVLAVARYRGREYTGLSPSLEMLP